jgi:hypothetical protein
MIAPARPNRRAALASLAAAPGAAADPFDGFTFGRAVPAAACTGLAAARADLVENAV